jgi:hypothetical protein
MKFTDKGTEVIMELKYEEAERLWTIMHTTHTLMTAGFEQIPKRDIKLVVKIADGLDEYCNS